MEDGARPDPPSASRRGGWLLTLVVVVALGAFAYNRSDSGGGDDAEDRLVEVTFKVEGTASYADVTVGLPNGDTKQFSPDVPMTNKKTGKHGVTGTFTVGEFVHLSAQNNTELGTVECIILGSDGTEISHSSSSTDYGIASCDGVAR